MTDRYQIQIDLNGRDNLSRQLGGVNREIDTLTRQSTQAGRSASMLGMDLNTLARSASAIGAGLLAGGLVNMISDMSALGSAVGATDIVFKQLVGSQDEYNRTLQALRDVTGGVVNDMNLMEGASSLLRMQLANTNDEAVGLIDMALKLKKPTDDASSAIENFALMLANQSVQRLDSFGISSAKVRERIDELIRSGQALNREDAFKMAVMEEGARAIDRLGDAATVGVTNVDKLRTRFENMSHDFGVAVNSMVEGAATLVEDVFSIFDEPIEMNVSLTFDDAVQTTSDTRAALMTASANMGNIIVGSGANAFPVSPDYPYAGGIVTESRISRFGVNPNPLGDLSDIQPRGTTRSELAASAFAERELRQQRALDEAVIRGRAIYEDLFATLASGRERAIRDVYEMNRAQSDEFMLIGQLTGEWEAFWDVASANAIGSTSGGLQIIDRDGAKALRDSAREVEILFEQFSAAASDSEFVTDAEVDRMRMMAEQARGVADMAGEAAARFESMSLSQLLGQESGGRAGELLDLVLGQLQGGTLDEATRAGALAVGRETDVSLALREDVAPLIARIMEDIGVDAGIEALERVNEVLDAGTLAGLDSDTMRQAIEQAVGYTMGAGGNFAINPGDSLMAVMGRTGMSAEDIFGATGATNSRNLPVGEFGGMGELMPLEDMTLFEELTSDVADNTTTMSADLENVRGSFETMGEPVAVARDELSKLADGFSTLAATTYTTTVAIDLVFNDPSGAGLANSPAFQNAVSMALRAQGTVLAQ